MMMLRSRARVLLPLQNESNEGKAKAAAGGNRVKKPVFPRGASSSQQLQQQQISNNGYFITRRCGCFLISLLVSTVLSVAAIVLCRGYGPTTHHHQPSSKWNQNHHDQSSIPLVDILSIAQHSLQSRNVAEWFHKIYIILDDRTVWAVTLVENNSTLSKLVSDRARFTEPTIVRAAQRLWHNTNDPAVLVMLVNYDDSTFCCNDPRIATTFGEQLVPAGAALPIVTLSAPVDCNVSIPFPTYETIIRARKGVQFASWGTYFWSYPWSRRRRQAVWRGSPTGPSSTNMSTRIQLVQNFGISPLYQDLVDAKLVGDANQWPILLEHPEFLGNRLGVRDFQNYRAVIDVDGNSWSSRFGGLLCYTAVVLKVQPAHVDYFFAELKPGIHYLPVRSDLTNLVEQVKYAVADENASAMRSIVRNANAWCAQKLHLSVLEQDMATIFNFYASLQKIKYLRQDVEPLLHQYNFIPLIT